MFDDSKILTLSRDGTARLWDLKGNLIINLDKHTNDVLSASFSPNGQKIITSMSSIDKEYKKYMSEEKKYISKMQKSNIVGLLLSKKIIEKNIKKVTFDRSGFKFHGRISSIAIELKKNGILC